MKTRDIALSSSLIGIYVSIMIICAATPLKVGSIMFSALFGLFWHYFTTKQNLAFQAGRIAWNMAKMFRQIPAFMAIMRGQSFAGLVFLEWVNNTQPGEIYIGGYRLLEATLRAQPVFIVYVFAFVYISVICLSLPYVFYRYFKTKGIFERLPEF